MPFITGLIPAPTDDQDIISPTTLAEAEQVKDVQREDAGNSCVDDKGAAVRIFPTHARQEVHVIADPKMSE